MPGGRGTNSKAERFGGSEADRSEARGGDSGETGSSEADSTEAE